jgi:hypothetical protein
MDFMNFMDPENLGNQENERKRFNRNPHMPPSIPRYPPQAESNLLESFGNEEQWTQTKSSAGIENDDWFVMQFKNAKLIVDGENKLFMLFSDEQPRGKRPQGGGAVNSAPQSH